MAELDLTKNAEAQARATASILATSRQLPTISASFRETLRGIDNMNLRNKAPLVGLANSFDAVRPVLAPAIAETLTRYKSAMLAPGLADAIRNSQLGSTQPIADAAARAGMLTSATSAANFANLVQPRLAEVLKEWQVPHALIGGVAEAIRQTGPIPQGQFASLAADAVRRAAEVAADPTVEEVAKEAVAPLSVDRLSRKNRGELRAYVVGAIGSLAGVIAVLVHNDQIDLASQLLWLLACFIGVYGLLPKE